MRFYLDFNRVILIKTIILIKIKLPKHSIVIKITQSNRNNKIVLSWKIM